MKNKRREITVFSVVLVLMAFGLGSCQRGRAAHPAASLQRTIASQLDNSDICPNGDSKDVQNVVDAADADGLARLPAGCYLISTTINIPPGIQLVGAGADKTILYRDPKRITFQPILRVQGKAGAPGGSQISGLALVGVRDTNNTGAVYLGQRCPGWTI